MITPRPILAPKSDNNFMRIAEEGSQESMIQALIKYHIVRLKNGPELYQLLLKVE
jgi:hypothetical protein